MKAKTNARLKLKLETLPNFKETSKEGNSNSSRRPKIKDHNQLHKMNVWPRKKHKDETHFTIPIEHKLFCSILFLYDKVTFQH